MKRPSAIERPLRLFTGIVLFAYATCHFVNHAFGILDVAVMEAASRVLLSPWKNPVGGVLLYGSFAVHAVLGLMALYRRRHIRVPPTDLWQLASGLLIPVLLLPHAVGVRLGDLLFGFEDSYARLVYHYWIRSPEGLPQQLVLLLVVWIHGCIGLRNSLKLKPWYPGWAPTLAAAATLIPVLGIVGLFNAGWNLEADVSDNPGAFQRLAQPLGDPERATAERKVGQWSGFVVWSWVALVGGVVAVRAGRDWYERRFRSIRLRYPAGREVVVPKGFSVLEASRWAGIPHAAVCGGRGRCSTCRVRVGTGHESLPAPGPTEQTTLGRIDAPPHVRLACQLRPTSDITVELLVPQAAPTPGAAGGQLGSLESEGREITIAAIFVDLRDSTRLASGRLPFDALFLLGRYIQTVAQSVRANGGVVTSIAGDGVMSIFGEDRNPRAAARSALAAAVAIWRGIDLLNEDLADELDEPLRIGMGIHVGSCIVGRIRSAGEEHAVQFLGETGNIAARLEAQSKSRRCTLVLSQAAADLAEVDLRGSGAESADLELRGLTEVIRGYLVRDLAEFEARI